MLISGGGIIPFAAGVLKVGLGLGQWSGNDAVLALSFPLSIVFGIVLWAQVLGLVWRGRRAYLQRRGRMVAGSVVESRYRRVSRATGLDEHRVRIEVDFVHPETGMDHRLQKEYMFTPFRQGRACALNARFPEGATMPMLVRGRSGAFDIPERPGWVDIW
ncbi:hypothetical protein ACTWPB_11035 [Nocardia sp. IBHARD005]|uniref:hypothetical protein n=1 Tax=Nocardia sp. IBHARD005 TaxID=3457765 RepID=UPI004057DA3B